MQLQKHALVYALLSGCGGDVASIMVMGFVALLTGWAISASLRRDGSGSDEKNIEGAAALLPRFQTPSWLEESGALLRVFGAEDVKDAVNTIVVPGLPFPVGYVVDISELLVRFNDLRIDGVEHSPEDLHKIALTNLHELEPTLALPKSGVRVLRDDKGHAAVRALLIPGLLNEGDAVCVAAPSRDLLLIFPEGDDSAAREARALFDASSSTDQPIPKPLRVTSDGFGPARWPKP